MKSIIFIFLFLAQANSIVGQDSTVQYYPFLKKHYRNIVPPVSVEDALNQLDNVLTNEIKSHLRQENETVVMAEISRELGDFFIYRWKLNDNIKFPREQNKGIGVTPELITFFSGFGINHSQLIVRIIFTCYYKTLNNQEYLLIDEIEKVKKNFNSAQCQIVSAMDYWESQKIIEAKYDSMARSITFLKLSKNDTIGFRYYEHDRKSEFYISGTIDSINTQTNSVSLKVFDIVSDKRYREVYHNKRTVIKGDRLDIDTEKFFRFRDSSFNYRNGIKTLAIPAWQKYINAKYYGE